MRANLILVRKTVKMNKVLIMPLKPQGVVGHLYFIYLFIYLSIYLFIYLFNSEKENLQFVNL